MWLCIFMVENRVITGFNANYTRTIDLLTELLVGLLSLIMYGYLEALPGEGGGHVACLNFKTSCVSVYKCLSLIVIFAVTVPIWLREVVSCRDFILHAVATFWAMSLVGIYPGRASTYGHCLRHVFSIYRWVFNEIVPCWSSHNDDNGCKKIKKVSGL